MVDERLQLGFLALLVAVGAPAGVVGALVDTGDASLLALVGGARISTRSRRCTCTESVQGLALCMACSSQP